MDIYQLTLAQFERAVDNKQRDLADHELDMLIDNLNQLRPMALDRFLSALHRFARQFQQEHEVNELYHKVLQYKNSEQDWQHLFDLLSKEQQIQYLAQSALTYEYLSCYERAVQATMQAWVQAESQSNAMMSLLRQQLDRLEVLGLSELLLEQVESRLHRLGQRQEKQGFNQYYPLLERHIQQLSSHGQFATARRWVLLGLKCARQLKDKDRKQALLLLNNAVSIYEQQADVLPTPLAGHWQARREHLVQLRKDFVMQAAVDSLSAQSTYTKACKTFVQTIVATCVQWLGEPPCEFALIGIGSISRDALLPTSDVDCALLIAEQSYRQDAYFKQLIRLLSYQLQLLDTHFIIDSGDLTHLLEHEQSLLDTPTGLLQRYAPQHAMPLAAEHYSLHRPILLYASTHGAELLHDYQQQLAQAWELLPSQTQGLRRHQTAAWQFLKEHTDEYQRQINYAKRQGRDGDIKSCYLNPLVYAILDIAFYHGICTEGSGGLAQPLPLLINELVAKKLLYPAIGKAWQHALAVLVKFQVTPQSASDCQALQRLAHYFIAPLYQALAMLDELTKPALQQQALYDLYSYPVTHAIAQEQVATLSLATIKRYAYHQAKRLTSGYKQQAVFNALSAEQRAHYYQVLVQHLPKEQTFAILYPLGSLPIVSGKRLWTQIERTQLMRAIAELTNDQADTEFTLQTLGQAQANPLSVVLRELLWDSEQQVLKPASLQEETGRHSVYTSPAPAVHIKFYPAWPGMELAIRCLGERLTAGGIYPSQLAKLTLAGQSYPVLVSTSMPGNNLYQVLHHYPERLTQLEPKSLSRLILLSLLINPEDGKPGNYKVVPMPGTDQYRLVGIDNDQALVEPFIRKGLLSSVKLQVKCILFCLDTMKQSLNSDVVKEFVQLDASRILKEWLQTVWTKDEHIRQLFTEADIKAAKDKESILLPRLWQGIITKLYQKFTRMQCILTVQPDIAAIDLLCLVEPALGKVYAQSLQLKLTPYQRFKQLTQHAYDFTKNSQGMTQTSSLDILRSQLLQAPTWDDIQSRSKHSAQTALQELAIIELQSRQLREVEVALAQGNAMPFAALRLDNLKEHVLQTLNLKALSVNLQQEIINALQGGYYRHLRLKGCHSLTWQQLRSLLEHNRETLETLDISGCTQLGDNIALGDNLAGLIANRAKQLQKLHVNHLPRLYYLGYLAQGLYNEYRPLFPKLRHLSAKGCKNLQTINIQAPHLEYLWVNNAKQLSIINTASQQLQLLATDGCQRLPHLYWLKKYPSLKSLGKNQMVFIEHLIKISANNSISALTLSKLELNDACVAILVECLTNNQQVSIIDLSDNQITDEGAQQLIQLLKNNKIIQQLTLVGNPIQESVFKTLATVIKKRQELNELNLSTESNPFLLSVMSLGLNSDKTDGLLLYIKGIYEQRLYIGVGFEDKTFLLADKTIKVRYLYGVNNERLLATQRSYLNPIKNKHSILFILERLDVKQKFMEQSQRLANEISASASANASANAMIILAGMHLPRCTPEVSYQEGVEQAQRIGAVAYFECNPATGEGLDDVYGKSIEIWLTNKQLVEEEDDLNHTKVPVNNLSFSATSTGYPNPIQFFAHPNRSNPLLIYQRLVDSALTHQTLRHQLLPKLADSAQALIMKIRVVKGNSYILSVNGIYAYAQTDRVSFTKLNKPYAFTLEQKQTESSVTQLEGVDGIFQQTSIGINHRFILTDQGLYASGNNFYGQLGLGHTRAINGWAKVEGYSGIVQQIIAGPFHSLLLTDEGLYACGRNSSGQLGLGDHQGRVYFTQITSIPGTIAQLGIGLDYSLILSDNGFYACGNNFSARLGLKYERHATVFSPVEVLPIELIHQLKLKQQVDQLITLSTSQQDLSAKLEGSDKPTPR